MRTALRTTLPLATLALFPWISTEGLEPAPPPDRLEAACGGAAGLRAFEARVPLEALGEVRPGRLGARLVAGKEGGPAARLIFTSHPDEPVSSRNRAARDLPGEVNRENERGWEELTRLHQERMEVQDQLRGLEAVIKDPGTSPQLVDQAMFQAGVLRVRLSNLDSEIEEKGKELYQDPDALQTPLGKARRDLWSLMREKENLERAIEGLEEAKRLAAADEPFKAALDKEIQGFREKLAPIEKQIGARRAEVARIRSGRSSGPKAERREAAIRGLYHGSGPASIELIELPARSGEARTLGAYTIELRADPPDDRTIVNAWALAYARDLAREIQAAPRGSDLGFQRHTVRQLVERFGLDRSVLEPDVRDGVPGAGAPAPPDLLMEDETRSVDLYSVTTGALAIEESLQLGVRLRPREEIEGHQTPIAELAGPEIKSHPFAAMLAGKKPALEATAGFAPRDAWYLHFSSITAQVRLGDLLDQWGTSFLQGLEVSSRDRRLKEKIEEQLCLEVSALTRLFGELAIGQVAIIGSDLYLHDGSALALVLEARNRPVLEAQMARHRSAARSRRPDARESSRAHGGTTIRSLATADRRVSSHACDLGGFRVVSNSAAFLERVIDAHAGMIPSLRGSPDFVYLRTIFTSAGAADQGFLYFSDPFIREVVGPRQKIGRVRQMECIARLRGLQFGALEAALEAGGGRAGSAPTAGSLREAALVGDLTCPDGGRYSLEAAGEGLEAVCSVHNRLLRGTPLLEIPLPLATGTEARAYRAFVENYSRYWSRFFDPIGIRLRVPAGPATRLEAETCILPLIENSIYEGLRRFIGGEPVALRSPSGPRSIAGLAIKLPGKEQVFEAFEEAFSLRNRASYPDGLSDLIDQLGGGLSVAVHDGDLLFTFSPGVERELGLFRGALDGEAFFLGLLLSAITLPISVSVDVKDPRASREALDRLLAALAEQARGHQFVEAGMETAAAGSYKGVPVFLTTLDLFIVRFHLHHAFVGDRLVIATQKWALLGAIDAQGAGEGEGAAKRTADPANFLLEIEPASFQSVRGTVGTAWQEKMREACLASFPALRPVLDLAALAGRPPEAESLRLFGAAPFCPSGGKYSRDPDRGAPLCSVHRHPQDPAQPLEAAGDEPLIRFLGGLKRIQASFRFTEEGVRTRLIIEGRP